MKTHTQDFKNGIKQLGRQLDSKITYTESEVVELGNEELNSITPHYQGALLKSVMKQLDIDSNVDIPLDTEINYQLGLKVGNSYEYLDFGNYIVYSSEKQEDTRSYKIVCYDKMLYSMKQYEGVTGTFPMNIRSYLSAICSKLGLTFKNSSDTFTNYDKIMNNDPYLASDGTPLDYTYRDVLDELSQVTASTICLDNNDELEVRYVNQTEGKNLFTINNYSKSGWIITIDNPLKNMSVGNYTISCQNRYINAGSGKSVRIYFSNTIAGDTSTAIGSYFTDYSFGASVMSKTKSLTQEQLNASYMILFPNDNAGTQQVLEDMKIMIESGSSASTYEPYGDTIDEEYLKDVNVTFGERFGPVNSVVLTRSGGSDSIYRNDDASISQNGLTEVKIEDNQIMNNNDRDSFIDGIWNKLNGLQYYVNDYTSIGICYYDLLDRYNVKVGNTYYSCLMLNDEVDVTQGLVEEIHAESIEQSETDYTKADKTDRRIKQAYIIVDKQNQQINAVVQNVNTLTNVVNSQGEQVDALGTQLTQSLNQVQVNVTAIQNTLANGVNLVKTTSVTIDDNGLSVSTDNSKIITTMTNNAFQIKTRGMTDALAFFGYDEEVGTSKAQMDNLKITNYFMIGCHRAEKSPSEQKTLIFYIGG